MASQCISNIFHHSKLYNSRLKFPINYLNITRQKRRMPKKYLQYPITYLNMAEINNETCVYPPIIDMSKGGQVRHRRQLWYDLIKAKPTVEEKLFEIANQQRMELKTYLLPSVSPTYNGAFYQRYITRTLLIDGLPDKLKLMNVDKELEDIRDILNETVYNYYCNPWRNNGSKQLSDYLNETDAGAKLLNQLVTQCYKKLALRNEYILESTIQQKPRLSSYWWHGGFDSKDNKVYERNLCFLFEDFGAFAIRTRQPLSPIFELDDPMCATADVPDYHYHPDALQISSNNSNLASVPGFWPGDPNEFPLLLVVTSDKMKNLLKKLEKFDQSKIEESVGLMASFGYLNGIATNQGFTQFHDITYPFVTQTILTNGQDFTFFVYQLNTTAFHEDVDKKDRRNLCWTSGKLRLFETVEDGHIKGINDEVYKLLLKFLLNAPMLKEGLELKPYLGADTRTEDEALNVRFFCRKLFSQAPNHQVTRYEVPLWVQIYKNHPDAPPSPYVRLE